MGSGSPLGVTGISVFVTISQVAVRLTYSLCIRSVLPGDKHSWRVKLSAHLYVIWGFHNVWMFISICPCSMVLEVCT